MRPTKPRRLRIKGLPAGTRPAGRIGVTLDHNELARRLAETDAALERMKAAPHEYDGYYDYDERNDALDELDEAYRQDWERMQKIGHLLASWYDIRNWWTEGAR